MKILVVNAGSSSLKYQLIETETEKIMAKGICERIGFGGQIEHKMPGRDAFSLAKDLPTHTDAVRFLLSILTDPVHGCLTSMEEIAAVGHRVVHGGPYFSESVLVTPEVVEKLALCRDLAPLHTAPALMGIEGCTGAMPGIPQVLVFDTAFHHTIPAHAYTYPIDKETAEEYHIRKYGFHGTSHRYVSQEMIRILGGKAEGTRIVSCHLGNGSSISAVKDGKVIDTTMGFTPLDGVPMGTRCGSIDPAIVTYLMDKKGWSTVKVNEYLNKSCGILGISGVSSDCRDIVGAADNGNEDARLALDVLSYQIKKYIGAYAAAMGGLDAIVFTAGVGENQAVIRKGSTEGLDFLGVDFDDDANLAVKRPAPVTCLSKPDSRVKVYLIPTNEELVIAKDTAAIVSASSSS